MKLGKPLATGFAEESVETEVQWTPADDTAGVAEEASAAPESGPRQVVEASAS
jgi:hypothetical protein